eukprot:Nitzschia sp. Nitz4//scaffold27_size158506//91455//91838//NITZ4_002605-RA/size158506-processed-gene-0.21-mRNA-1//1//CDS//3329545503//606//frame0
MNCPATPTPATEALEKALRQVTMPSVERVKPKIRRRSTAISRRGSLDSAFNFTRIEEATKEVEESVAFPMIDWSFNEEEEEELIDSGIQKLPKRRCQGLARTGCSIDLYKLSAEACRSRRGSTGSML